MRTKKKMKVKDEEEEGQDAAMTSNGNTWEGESQTCHLKFFIVNIEEPIY